MNPQTEKKFGFDVISEIDRIATENRRERESALEILDFEKQKADARERILNAAKLRGENFSDEDIEKATQLYFQRQFQFKETPSSFKTKLADAYIDRARIGKKYGIPILAAALIAGATMLTASIGKNIARANAESRVERSVVSAYQQKAELESALFKESLAIKDTNLIETDANQATLLLSSAGKSISQNDEFFNQFYGKGDVKSRVTPQNYQDVATKVKEVDKTLGAASSDLDKVESIVNFQNNLNTVKQGLEACLQEIKSSHTAPVLMQRADSAYAGGIADIQARNLVDAKAHEVELKAVASDIRQYGVLPAQEAQVYFAVKAVVAKDETEGIRMADNLHQEAQTYIASADIPRLGQTIQKLGGLTDLLTKEYTTYLVYGDRRQPDDDNSIVRYYYLLQNKDNNGNIVQQVIINEETKQQMTVNKWGYRVGEIKLGFGETPQSVKDNGQEPTLYKKLVSDLRDNGVIDDAIFAKKQRGYLKPKIVMPGIPANSGEYPYD
jgi:hypothetical protein